MVARVLGLLLLGGAVLALTLHDRDTHPRGPVDLSGTYHTGTVTPLERSAEFGTQLEVSPDSEAAERLRRAAPPTPENSLDYLSFEQGNEPVRIDGQLHTSIIFNPDTGRLPALTEAGQARFRKAIQRMRPTEDGVWWLDLPAGPFDGPEDRPLEERCLVDSTGSAGPPALPASYNNIKRIVQTDDAVLIVNEMMHDARVVRLNAEHRPDVIRSWLGDSIGWWDDGVLVVETTNFRAQTGLFLAGEHLKVMEWFRKTDDGALHYRFRVEDHMTWQEPWEGEYVWRATDQRMYEYACHEGNYSLAGILKGARVAEAETRQALEASNHSAATELTGVSPPGTGRNRSAASDFRNASRASE